MLSVKKIRQKSERQRRREALQRFLQVVRNAESTPELIRQVAEHKFYMKCCAALAKNKNKAGELFGLARELEQEARIKRYCLEDIKKRLVPVAGVLGLGSPRDAPEALQKDYYRLLGIAPGVRETDIKKAYRRLARQAHPDTKGGDKNRFLALHEAYEVLADPERRRQYDDSREHAMHLGWSEHEHPPRHYHDTAEQKLWGSQFRRYVFLLAAIVLMLACIAFVVDAVVRRV